MNEKYDIAVVGATGSVGREIIQILEQREFPVNNIYFLASSKSEGSKIQFDSNHKLKHFLSDLEKVPYY